MITYSNTSETSCVFISAPHETWKGNHHLEKVNFWGLQKQANISLSLSHSHVHLACWGLSLSLGYKYPGYLRRRLFCSFLNLKATRYRWNWTSFSVAAGGGGRQKERERERIEAAAYPHTHHAREVLASWSHSQTASRRSAETFPHLALPIEYSSLSLQLSKTTVPHVHTRRPSLCYDSYCGSSQLISPTSLHPSSPTTGSTPLIIQRNAMNIINSPHLHARHSFGSRGAEVGGPSLCVVVGKMISRSPLLCMARRNDSIYAAAAFMFWYVPLLHVVLQAYSVYGSENWKFVIWNSI